MPNFIFRKPENYDPLPGVHFLKQILPFSLTVLLSFTGIVTLLFTFNIPTVKIASGNTADTIGRNDTN